MTGNKGVSMTGKRCVASFAFCTLTRWALAASAISLAGCLGLNAASLSPRKGAELRHDPQPERCTPRWSGAALVWVEDNDTAHPELLAMDAAGRALPTIRFGIPGAYFVAVNSIARGADGTTALTGHSIADDGRIAHFLAWVAPDGTASQVIRTDPFLPRQVCLTSDGTLWTEGQRAQGSDLDSGPTGGIIRHFDRTGRLIGSFVPASSLEDEVQAAMGFLAAAGNRVGWISSGHRRPGTTVPGSYLEIDGDGTTRQYPLPASTQEPSIYGFAMTEDGFVFAEVATGDDSHGKLVLMSLDREHRIWAPAIAPDVPQGTNSFLLGASGNTVALWDKQSRIVHLLDAAK